MNFNVSIRMGKIKKNGNSTKSMYHDFRKKDPGYLRRNNQNCILDIHGDGDEEFKIKDTEFIEKMKQKHTSYIEEAREQYKKHTGKSLPRNTNFEVEGIITFGVDDEVKSMRKDDDGLLPEEVDLINSQKKDEYVKKFLKNLEEKNGIKVLYCVRHSDEKTDHYHFQTINYDFKRNQTLYKNMGKKEMAEFGSKLQDDVAEAFDGSIFKRGMKDRKDKKKHLTVVEMHQKEQEQLKKQIQQQKKEVEELNIKDIRYSSTYIDRNSIFEKKVQLPAHLLLIRKSDIQKVQKIKNIVSETQIENIEKMNNIIDEQKKYIQKQNEYIEQQQKTNDELKKTYQTRLKEIRSNVTTEVDDIVRKKDDEISKLRQEISSQKNIIDNLKTEIQHITTDLNKKINNIYTKIKSKFNITRNQIDDTSSSSQQMER